MFYIITYIIIVDLHVLLQVRPRSELLVAFFAFVRLVPRVDPLVSDQVTNLNIRNYG